jgi:hypothetical protein
MSGSGVLFFVFFVIAAITAVYFYNKYTVDIKSIADALEEKSQLVEDLVTAINSKKLSANVNLAKLKKAQDDLIIETQKATQLQATLTQTQTQLDVAIQKAQDTITKTNDFILQFYLTNSNAEIIKKLVNIRDFVLPNIIPSNLINTACVEFNPDNVVVRKYDTVTIKTEPQTYQAILYDGAPCNSTDLNQKLSNLITAMIENTGIIPQIPVDKTYYYWNDYTFYEMTDNPATPFAFQNINYSDSPGLFPPNPKDYKHIAVRRPDSQLWDVYDYTLYTKCTTPSPIYTSDVIAPESTSDIIYVTKRQHQPPGTKCIGLAPETHSFQTLMPDTMSKEWRDYQQIKLDINSLISVLIDQVCVDGKINANRMINLMRTVTDRYCKPDSKYIQTYFSKLFDLFIGPLSADMLSQKDKPLTPYEVKPEVFILTEPLVSKADAASTAAQKGYRLATFAELLDAHSNGAHWCAWGWVSDKPNLYIPLQDYTTPYCAEPGLQTSVPPSGGLYAPICYGIKPQTGARPYNEHKKIYYQRKNKPYPIVGPKNGEVFQVGSPYIYTKDEAEMVCKAYNAQVATKSQIESAQKRGAEWCSTGWVADDPQAMYPMQTTKPGCGGPGINVYTPPDNKASVNCFGVKPPTGAKWFNSNSYYQSPEPRNEVFHIGGYNNLKSQAEAVCKTYNAQVATKQQLVDAQALGAEWCSTGWVADDPQAMYPMQTTKPGCGGPGINVYIPPDNKAGVNCYGIKPASGPLAWNTSSGAYFARS